MKIYALSLLYISNIKPITNLDPNLSVMYKNYYTSYDLCYYQIILRLFLVNLFQNRRLFVFYDIIFLFF